MKTKSCLLYEFHENENLYNKLFSISEALNDFVADFSQHTPKKELLNVFMDHEDLEKLDAANEILERMKNDAYKYATTKGNQLLKLDC